MAADNSRMLARRIEETFDGEDTSPRGGSQPSQYEERVWFSQFQDPDQVFRHILTYRIGGESERMPLPLVHALVLVKKAAAHVNARLGLLDQFRAECAEFDAREAARNEK